MSDLKQMRKEKSIAGLSLKTLLLAVMGILLFGIYVGVLIYGENSVTVLTQLKQKKNDLIWQEKRLKEKNQQLQKEYFELKQLEPQGE
ncbi:MAG: hypothetical protein RL113_631 [Pseudomonadota bacterium]|jgi:hypothetical protein